MLPNENVDLVFHRPIPSWDEGLPLGNGRMGCLIWGEPDELRFSLDRVDIWDVTQQPEFRQADFTYETLVRLVREKKTEEINRLFSHPGHRTTPTKLVTGKLLFHFPAGAPCRFALSLRRAEATAEIGTAKLRTFTAADRYVGMVQIQTDGGPVPFELKNPEFGLLGEQVDTTPVNTRLSNGSLKKLKYPAPQITDRSELKQFIQQVSGDFAFGITVGIREKGNTLELAYTVACSHDGENWAADAETRVNEALSEGYDRVLEGHLRWWEAYWSASSLTLPEPLMQKNWYLSHYLLGSCSRKGSAPMPLQGVWTADDGELPPWKGDYHHDTNTEMSYYSYAKANHAEQGESFLDFLWERMPAAEEFARKFYGAEGICLPGNTDFDGRPIGGWPMYCFGSTHQLWLCQSFERHFRYTGDRKFLQNRAYPYMKATAEFFLSILERREDGTLVLPVSASPEIHDDRQEAWVTPNSNYDLALLRYLFLRLADFARLLSNGEEAHWEQTLSQLPPLAVDDRKVLMIAPDEILTVSHRHHSHAMAIHPLRLLDYEKPEDREIIDATVTDLEHLGYGEWVGFSFPWMAEFNAIQGNGEGAAWMLRTFWENFCLPNGFHANGDYRHRGCSRFHYRPFTLEANMCAADALQEMLLYSENGTVRVFPAVPERWLESGCSFEGFCAENGVVVSAEAKNGTVTAVTLLPKYDGAVRFRSPWTCPRAEGAEIEPDPAHPGDWTVKLTAGRQCTLLPASR